MEDVSIKNVPVSKAKLAESEEDDKEEGELSSD